MIRILLDPATRDEINALRRTTRSSKVRDRIEMVALSDAGWSSPRIANHLGYCCHSVRGLLHDFQGRGVPALSPRRTGPAPDLARRSQIGDALRQLLGEDRTWTGRQLSEALHDRGLAIGPRQVRRHLGRLGAGYLRTVTTLKHQQDPAKVERAAKVLHGLKKKAAAGRLKLYYLDECGFVPTLPVSYSWCLPGQRKPVRYEYSQGRRINALAAIRPYGRSPRLEVITADRTWKAEDLVGFLKSLPWSRRPRVVVLDNAGLHAKAARLWRVELRKSGIYLYFLPACSPELNEIESVFRQVKYQEMPVRSHTSGESLRKAVLEGFDSYRGKLRSKSVRKPGLAA